MSNHPNDIPPKEDRNNFPSLERLRVLVVDDNADSCILIRFIVEGYGVQVMTAVSAREALAAMERFEPHVLVSDLAMPQVDGYWLIGQVRTLNPPLRKIPAIAITAMATTEVRNKAFEAGFQSFVTKPVDPIDLVTQIMKVAPLTLCLYVISATIDAVKHLWRQKGWEPGV